MVSSVLYDDEGMNTHDTFLQKYISHNFIPRKVLKLAVRVKEGQGDGLWQRTAILTHMFLATLCHFRVLSFYFFDGGFLTGAHFRPLPPSPQGTRQPHARALRTSWLPNHVTARLQDCPYLIGVPMYILFDNAYIFFRLSTHVSCFQSFTGILYVHAIASCVEKFFVGGSVNTNTNNSI